MHHRPLPFLVSLLAGVAALLMSCQARADWLAPPMVSSGGLFGPPGSVGPGIVQSPGRQCRAAIRVAEQAAGIPRQLMAAIAHVESGRANGMGRVDPWPWSINVEGADHVYDTKEAAIAAVQAFRASGAKSIDVGCMQVNLLYHPNAFASLDAAFDPAANAAYAARFLTELYAKTGSWPGATAYYHSASPQLGAEYERKVAAVWPAEQRQPDAAGWQPPTVTSPNMVAGGGTMLSNHADSARIIPMANGAGSGRGLDAYRAMPVPVASRFTGRAPL